ncbi:uncharacterized protein LOC113341748 [Papaver somniferum]|uniref:uncharacterized protein LOC113341748 n=1 Tax=Papaver somniferum TaxID=3469 RepID=UPI000E6F5B8C|nr:uncharacterized protein LOC113341748 [Papaver somniferum]
MVTSQATTSHIPSPSDQINVPKQAALNNKYNFRKNQEPKNICSASFCQKLNLPGMEKMVIHNSCQGRKGNIWLFRNKCIAQPQVVSFSSQMITVSVGDVLVSGVHAHVKVVQRRFLWSEMQIISDLKRPWIILGDFNAVMSDEEKVGGRLLNRNAMLEFNECINQYELLNAPKTGLQFSWSNCQQGNKRILCNLDRVLFNQQWLQKYGDWGFKVGMKIVSDHAPLLGGCASIPKPRNTPRKFQKMWVLNDWNWKGFGNVKVKIKEAEERVKVATEFSDRNPFDEEALNDLVKAKNGHASREDQIAQHLVNHFQKKFEFVPMNVDDELLEVIPKVITEEDQRVLDIMPEEEEMKKTIFEMDQDSAPGPDGFSARVSVLLNGGPCGLFQVERGLRQGDPLSPILFVIMEEVLSRNITALVEKDDVFIFNGGRKSLLNILHLLDTYQACSGQVINKSKSKLFVDDTTQQMKNLISEIVNMEIANFPDKYLGVYLAPCKVTSAMVWSIVELIQRKLAAWKGRLLSFRDRLVLVKFVLCSFPIYSMSIYKWPGSVIKVCENLIRNFLWTGDGDVRKFKTISWKRVCTPYEEGGLGIKRLKIINKSLLMKMMWKILNSKEEWALFFSAKFKDRKGQWTCN